MNRKLTAKQADKQLRQIAEARLATCGSMLPTLDIVKLKHEYAVYTIELEMQNEALRQAQTALEKSRDQYLDLYDFSPVGYITLTPDGQIVEANLTAAKLLGRGRAQLTGQLLVRYVAGDDRDGWRLLLNRVIRQGKAAHSEDQSELCFQRDDGGSFYGKLDCLYVDQQGDAPTIRMSIIDIGDISSRERSRREGESRYRALYESMRDAFAMVDMAGNLVLFNRVFREMLGYSEEELKQKSYIDLTVQKWHAAEAHIVEQQVLPFGESTVYEKEYIRKDGTIIPVELKVFLLSDTNGQHQGMWGVVRDISDRKQAEARLADSELRYRMAMQAISGAVYDWNMLTNDACFTERFVCLIGEVFPGGISVRDWWRDRVHPEDYPRLKTDILRAMQTQIGLNHTAYRIHHKDGHWVHVSDRSYVLFDGEGRAVRMIGSLTDISARVRAETALRRLNDSLEEQVLERSAELRLRADQLHESEHFIRTTLDALSSAVAVIDETEKIIFANKVWQDLSTNGGGFEVNGDLGDFGYLPCFSEAANCAAYKKTYTKISGAIKAMLAGKRQNFTLEYPCKLTTETRWFSIRIDRFKGSASLWLVITHDEITERKLAAEELSRVASNFKKMLRKVELAHEEDSKQIAREVHDQLGATLTMLKLGLATSTSHRDLPDPLKEKFEGMIDLADQALKSVKRVSARLRPSMLDTLGLVAALKWHVKEFSSMTGIAVDIQLPDYIKLVPERGNAVFRIIQESLTNIARHSHASKVSILGRKTKRHLVFMVTDNGVGLNPKASGKRDSFGVIGMQERAIYLGGTFRLDSRIDGGVCMTLQIPMEIKAHQPEEDLFS